METIQNKRPLLTVKAKLRKPTRKKGTSPEPTIEDYRNYIKESSGKVLPCSEEWFRDLESE